MKINIILYDSVTALDAVGPYEVLGRLPGAEVHFVAERAGPVRTDTGHQLLVAAASLAEAPAADLVLVPGGYRPPIEPGPVHDWLRAADATSTWTTSVCVGSLVLAAAGLLTGRRATSHWMTLDRLPSFGAVPVPDRVVVDGKYATAAGVSAGIDLALDLAGRIAGAEAAQTIQLGIEYDPAPPFAAGSPDKAPAPIVDFLREHRELVVGL
ncbi:DJ-1/PfpI family protein [Paractinoplanes rishiriensis]|uniref:Glutamine amidotransferase n=1 Tax=Paractinoplanes rishiriensis TaxID=1050105 RepID=A0A919JW97_9ACTN|nr:DJ-1/PfpI family protein [Actinoplanes rishiriensis]GIE95998.1 glutamine amidotransferase [Actinoplanes rishiriensis]